MKKTALVIILWMGIGASFTSQVLAGIEGLTETIYGYEAGAFITGIDPRRYATFIGSCAGYYNTDGYYNTFLGFNAGYFNTIGSSNTFLGYSAGHSNTSSSYNTFIGDRAGYSNTTGSLNTFLG